MGEEDLALVKSHGGYFAQTFTKHANWTNVLLKVVFWNQKVLYTKQAKLWKQRCFRGVGVFVQTRRMHVPIYKKPPAKSPPTPLPAPPCVRSERGSTPVDIFRWIMMVQR